MANATHVNLTIQKVARTSLNDGPGGQYVSTTTVIEVEFDALTDQGSVHGVVEFEEGFGGTTIR